MVRRTGDAHLSSSRGLSADGVTCKSLAGAEVASLIAFGHPIDSPNTVRPKATPNILSSTCHAYRSTAVDRFLFAGPFQSRDRRERSRPSGVPLQPLQGSESSVGLGVFLRRCATGTSQICCPRTLLCVDLVPCAHMGGPFSRLPSSQPTIQGGFLSGFQPYISASTRV